MFARVHGVPPYEGCAVALIVGRGLAPAVCRKVTLSLERTRTTRPYTGNSVAALPMKRCRSLAMGFLP